MQPLGFYGVKCEPAIETAIDNLSLDDLKDLFADINFNIWGQSFVAEENGFDEWFDNISDIEKIGLIRGLCDRIELKLMEQAK